ncbi:hypothetical protein WJX72_012456 [[Myrmecia] bisecta]|uniref:SAP domain-containing protein n=1 Tax=[Myrmecia] bisecta TaxID=41462 RepID=A0AAW1PMP3_9CHLO
MSLYLSIPCTPEGDVWKSEELEVEAGNTLEYKYVVIAEDGSIRRWQEGENAMVKIPATAPVSGVMRVDDDWEESNQKGAALVVHGKALPDMTVAELKVLLRERGLKQTGRKVDLISRLEEALVH